MAQFQLPADLKDFLSAGKQLEYDDTVFCEAGQVSLRPLEELAFTDFPVITEYTRIAEQDPHRGEEGYYHVPGISLLATCDDSYSPEGILIYFPQHNRYGTFDCDHAELTMFDPAVTWETIVGNPVYYLNAQWEGTFPLFEPWHEYTFSPGSPY